MRAARKRGLVAVAPIAVSMALILSACGGGSDDATDTTAQQVPESVAGAVTDTLDATVPDTAAAPVGEAPVTAPKGDTAPAGDAAPVGDAPAAPVAGDTNAAPTGNAAPTAENKSGKATKVTKATGAVSTATQQGGGQVSREIGSIKGITPIDTAAQAKANEQIAAQKGGATDMGVTKDSIQLGSVNMHGVALGNLFVEPMVNGLKAVTASINDRGGILGRRLSLIDCDDGPGEVSRSKACIKKLVGQDKVFALLSYSSWASASVHSDLAQYKLPAVGTWAYSQTEWQDPYMFPTHMSMIHEAMAGAHWVKNVVKPKTYGLICLTSPEMQLSCNEVQKILDKSGSKMVKKLDVSIAEVSMSAQVLSMRSANPEHVVHYVINPATMVKFMVESAQQGYYPPLGISGNHLAAEVLGSLFGKHPAGRYWTNTTYKMWGPEFLATMNKYARGNQGLNHHIIQANYAGAMVFEKAAKAVGPNLTRERLMAQLGNGDVYQSDTALDQKFAYTKAERGGTAENQTWDPNGGQGREFMYKYTSENTVSNPDGTPNGFQPDPDQFVIYTHK